MLFTIYAIKRIKLHCAGQPICYIIFNMDVQVGDIIKVKKPHPCGCDRFFVVRVGIDFKIKCEKCERLIMIPRVKIEKKIRKIFRDGEELK